MEWLISAAVFVIVFLIVVAVLWPFTLTPEARARRMGSGADR